MTNGIRIPRRLLLAALTAGALAACRREARRFQEAPPTVTPDEMVTVGALQPGPAIVNSRMPDPYSGNAWAVSQGQMLFNAMNCSGCHSQGGGGMGPALMDSVWIYGSNPDQIFASIAEGRPNGMPAWKYSLSNQQIWELVAYVRSLSGLQPKGARSGRMDGMEVKVPEYQVGPHKPKNSTPGVLY